MPSFEHITGAYRESFAAHGDSVASLLTPKGRQSLRFRTLLPYLQTNSRVLDYGCGLGYLADYIAKHAPNAQYHGLDIMPEFIEACKKKARPGHEFTLMDPEDPIPGDSNYDIVFISGVFNLQSHPQIAESKAYAYERIRSLFVRAKHVLICDFLSGYTDYQQTHAQHFTVGEIADFCASQLSRRMIIRHDLLPYEFSLIVHRDATIKRPENMYQADLNEETLP